MSTATYSLNRKNGRKCITVHSIEANDVNLFENDALYSQSLQELNKQKREKIQQINRSMNTLRKTKTIAQIRAGYKS